jgi:hypothetical protein
VKETKEESCLDCLYCKVSATSTAYKRLYYCAKGNRETRLPETFWLTKKVCTEFENMEE